jgi:molybdopterin converting factor small subunit
MATVHFTANLRRHVECPSADFAAGTVHELLEHYFAARPQVRGFVLDDQGEVRKHVKILVDGSNLRDRARLTDALQNNSQVHVFQALSGG